MGAMRWSNPKPLKIAIGLTIGSSLLRILLAWLAAGNIGFYLGVEVAVLGIWGWTTFIAGLGLGLGGLAAAVSLSASQAWRRRGWLLATAVHAITVVLMLALPAVILSAISGPLARVIWAVWLGIALGPFGLISAVALVLLIQPSTRTAILRAGTT